MNRAFQSIIVLTTTNDYGTISIFALTAHWNLLKNVISRRLTKNCKASINRNFNANSPNELLQSTTEALLVILLRSENQDKNDKIGQFRTDKHSINRIRSNKAKTLARKRNPKTILGLGFNRQTTGGNLLQANYDVRTIQELLVGHSDLKTTMIYAYTVQSVTIKQAKSPLDS